MNRLFVYGIFLDQSMRDRYAMTGEHYATVKGYATIGDSIVAAIPMSESFALSGMVVDVAPSRSGITPPTRGLVVDNWQALDSLEAGYDRIKVTTTDGENCWMYVSRYYK